MSVNSISSSNFRENAPYILGGAGLVTGATGGYFVSKVLKLHIDKATNGLSQRVVDAYEDNIIYPMQQKLKNMSIHNGMNRDMIKDLLSNNPDTFGIRGSKNLMKDVDDFMWGRDDNALRIRMRNIAEEMRQRIKSTVRDGWDSSKKQIKNDISELEIEDLNKAIKQVRGRTTKIATGIGAAALTALGIATGISLQPKEEDYDDI